MFAATYNEAREMAPRSSVVMWATGMHGGRSGAMAGYVPDNWDGSTVYVLPQDDLVRCECCGRFQRRYL